MPRTIVHRDLGLYPHQLEQVAQHRDGGRELLGERGWRLVGLAFSHAQAGVGTPRNLGFVDERLGLRRGFLLLEGQQNARVLAADAQNVGGLAFLQDLDVHLGALLAE